MARRSLLTARTRQELFGIPEDPKQLTRFYTLSRNDHCLTRTRRRDENRLGLAIHIALLRHPGRGWLDGSVLPESFIMWLAEQLAMPDIDLVEYARRRKTKSEHHRIAMSHLGLRPFQAAHLETATLLAREAAFATDHGQDIMTALCTGLRKQNRLYLALGEIGRIERTLFMLDWLPSHTRTREGEFLARDGLEARCQLKPQKMTEGKSDCALAMAVHILPLDFHVGAVPQDTFDHGCHLGG